MVAVRKGSNGVAATFHDTAMVQYYLANDMQKLPTAEEQCGLLTVCLYSPPASTLHRHPSFCGRRSCGTIIVWNHAALSPSTRVQRLCVSAGSAPATVRC